MKGTTVLRIISGCALLALCLWFATWPREGTSQHQPATPSPPAPDSLQAEADADAPDNPVVNPSSAHPAAPTPSPPQDPQLSSQAPDSKTSIRQPDESKDTPLPFLNQTRAKALARVNGWKTRGEHNGVTYELQAIDGNVVLMNRTMNSFAAISTAADLVRETAPYNVDGSNILVGVWDAGSVMTSHQEFGGRVINEDGVASHFHATHVGGTIAASGVNASAKGMAPATTIASYDWNSDTDEIIARGMGALGQTNKIQISNHSYGFVVGWDYNWSPPRWFGDYTVGATNREAEGFGQYSSSTRAWDDMAYDLPYLLVCKSAGNDRDDAAPGNGANFQYFNSGSWITKSYDSSVDPLSDGQNNGFDTVGVRGNAKNILTVGALNDAWNGSSRQVSSATPAGFSGYGPTDDGRIKPDIGGNGVHLISAHNSATTSYTALSGTSMSSPNVAGSATLLANYYANLFSGAPISAVTLKGLILHTADDGGNAGPDYKYGWGLMNTKTAADLLKRHADFPTAQTLIEDEISSTNLSSSYSFIGDNQSLMRVTICWSDPPAPAQTGLNNTNLTLVNDLDIRLYTPDGATNFPFTLDPASPNTVAARGDNFRDNVEQILLTTTNAGEHILEVSIKGGSVSNDVQPYSVWISGATVKPALEHTELPNTTNDVDVFTLPLTATPATAIDTNAAWLVWMTLGDTNGFSSNLLSHVTNDLFEATIPAQSNGSTVLYYFQVANTDGITCYLPEDAPTNTFSFDITTPVTLTVTGTPFNIDIVTPDYGIHTYASGVTVNAQAPAFSIETNGTRYDSIGYTGTGSVPSTGSTESINFIIEVDSSVNWLWQQQFELDQSSDPASLLSTSIWFNANSTASTITADSSLTMSGTVYRFAHWTVDGLRQPDLTNTAVNPATDIFMATQVFATAVYLDETQDDDGDTLADWWETFYFGSTNADAGADTDGDGFTNLEEFNDESDPRDISNIPSPPGIAHTNLSAIQTQPAPFTVSAVITDNFQVAAATLIYNRNASGDTPMAMTNIGGDNYSADIPAPGTNTDAYTYFITASDPAGQTTTNGPHAFSIAYPILGITPTNDFTFLVKAGDSTNFTFTITNSGNSTLEWALTTQSPGLEESVENGSNGWVHSGPNDLWHIRGDRVFDGASAWHCGTGLAGNYVNDMNASLDTPPVLLGPGAALTFWHFADFELGGGSTAWDGAIVELSTNGGVNFAQITPVAGYPFTIVPNPASPFDDNQPCFANTSNDWREEEFDLSAFAGHTAVIRFRAGSDSFATEEGWYIDRIQLSPTDGTNNWLTLSAVTGSVEAASNEVVSVTMDSSGIASGKDRTRLALIQHNDPTQPADLIPMTLQVRTPPALTWTDTLQTSTNGQGLASLDFDVYDADGEDLQVRIEYSEDGIAWTQTFLSAATAQTGTPSISNASDSVIHQILSSNPLPITNSIFSVWSTTNSPAVLLGTAVTVRADAFDGTFWSDPVTSTPFIVDNEAPEFSNTLSSSSHVLSTWTSNQVITVNWATASDGDGIGLHGYSHLFTTALTQPDGNLTTVTTNIMSTSLAQDTQWTVRVQARDQFGNLSPVHDLGPFWIDSESPSSTSAVLTLSASDFGSYSVGPNLTGTWANITDTGSGISHYYIALTNGSASTNGTISFGLTDVLLGIEDATNTFFVWAEDNVGRIGDAVESSLLLLSPGGDHDGDGLSNAEEEITGTAATDSASLLQAENPTPISTNQTLPIIQWPIVSNRSYQVEWKDHAGYDDGAAWTVISNPVYIVTNGYAVWTDTNALSESFRTNRFYRIGVTITP